MYSDGVRVNTGSTGSGAPTDAATNINIGQYDSGGGYFLNGGISLVLIWNRVLSAVEVSAISANPWQIFRPAWPRGIVIKAPVSFTITENALPTHNTGGSVTVHAVGFNTTWTSGTTFSVSGVAGWSVASQTFVNGTHVTLALSCPAAGGATGTLTFSDGTRTATAGVAAPSISCSIATISVNDTATVTLTGSNTLWSQDNPAFTLSGGTGAAIGSISISSNTSATAAVSAGNAYSATLTIADPSSAATTTLSTASNTVTTTAYATRSGRLVAFVFGNNSNTPNVITAVSSNPTISVNGSPVSCLGPFWDMTSQIHPFLFYQLPSQVQATDVITFAASASWATTAAGAATAYSSGSAGNYTGSFEPPLFGYLPFDYLPTNTGGLQVGFNIGAAGGPLYYQAYFVGKNWMKHGYFGGSTVGSLTADGHPTTVTASNGQAVFYFANNNAANLVDYRQLPRSRRHLDPRRGRHRYRSADAGGASGQQQCGHDHEWTNNAERPTTAGTLVNGVLVGQTWQWTVAFKASPTQLNLNLTLVIQTHSGASGNYTLQNEWLFAPNGAGGSSQSLNRTNLAQTDQNVLNWLTVGSKGSASPAVHGAQHEQRRRLQQLLSVRRAQPE